jgi:hypothetical protein
MAYKRTHFFLPEGMLAAMDQIAGKGKRNSFVLEILGHEIRRRLLMQILSDAEPILKSEDHPEWKDGAYAWVRDLRESSDQKRSEKLGDWLSPGE